MTIRIPILVFSLLTLLLPISGQAAAPAASHARSVRAVTMTGYQFGVSGAGWGHNKRIVVTFAHGYISKGNALLDRITTEGVELRTASNGSFLVGVSGTTPCGQQFMRATVRDFSGHSALAFPQAKPCCPPSPVKVGSQPGCQTAAAGMKVLKGKQLHPSVAVVTPEGPSAITVHLGGVVELLSGVSERVSTLSSLSVDDAYLALFSTGTSGRCPPNASCPVPMPSMYWQWAAVRKGTTSIRLSPSCPPRQQCSRSVAITVHIV